MPRGPVSAETAAAMAAGQRDRRERERALKNGGAEWVGRVSTRYGIMYVRRRYPSHSPRPHGFGWWCMDDLDGVAVFSSAEDAKLATRECLEQRGNGVALLPEQVRAEDLTNETHWWLKTLPDGTRLGRWWSDGRILQIAARAGGMPALREQAILCCGQSCRLFGAQRQGEADFQQPAEWL